MFYFDEDHMENGFNEPAVAGIKLPEHHQPTVVTTTMTRSFQEAYQLRDDDLGSGAYACVRTCVSRANG